MKKPTLIGALLLIVGIAIGVILKPFESAPEDSPAASAKSSKRPGGPATGSPAPGAPGKSPRHSGKAWRAAGAPEGSLELNEETAKAFEQAQQAALGQIVHAQDRHLADLTQKLSLTPEQQQLLRARYFDPQREQHRQARIGPEANLEKSRPDLGKVIGEILTNEQLSTYRQLRADEQRRETESRTLRELAGMSYLDLTAEQRQAAYDVLYKTPSQLPAGGLTLEMTNGPEGTARIVTFQTVRMENGLTDRVHAIVNSADGAIGEIAVTTSVSPSEGTQGDPAEIEQARAKAINRDAARFREIFTPDQMASYRARLEARHNPAGAALPQDFPLPDIPE